MVHFSRGIQYAGPLFGHCVALSTLTHIIQPAAAVGAIFNKVHIKGLLIRHGQHVRRKSLTAITYRDKICQSVLERCDGKKNETRNRYESNIIE